MFRAQKAFKLGLAGIVLAVTCTGTALAESGDCRAHSGSVLFKRGQQTVVAGSYEKLGRFYVCRNAHDSGFYWLKKSVGNGGACGKVAVLAPNRSGKLTSAVASVRRCTQPVEAESPKVHRAQQEPGTAPAPQKRVRTVEALVLPDAG